MNLPTVMYAVSTEKAVGAIEKENKITFAIASNATKKQVKEEVEKLYGTKVAKVTTLFSSNGVKKAIVKFKESGKAADIAAKLKIL